MRGGGRGEAGGYSRKISDRNVPPRSFLNSDQKFISLRTSDPDPILRKANEN